MKEGLIIITSTGEIDQNWTLRRKAAIKYFIEKERKYQEKLRDESSRYQFEK